MKHSSNNKGEPIVAHTLEEMDDFQEELDALDIPKSKSNSDFGKATLSALSRMKKAGK